MHSLLCLVALPTLALDWVPVPVPSLCRSSTQPNLPPILVSGAHVDLQRADPQKSAPPAAPSLSWNTFLQIVEEDARARGSALELSRFEGGALARGETSGMIVLASELDAAGLALDVDLIVQMHAGNGAGTVERFERRVRSGDTLFLGTRERRTFVSGFDVQVAAEAGQSEPVVGEAHHGRGLHLWVARIAGGERVFVQGVFDVAEIVSIDPFDPETADLGIVEEPVVAWTQAWFSGTIDARGTLTARVCGAGGRTPDWTIEIQARARPDTTGAEASQRFVVLDLGFVCGPRRERTSASEAPFAGLPPLSQNTSPGALQSSALASQVETSRGPAPRGGRPPLYWSDSLLLVPAADTAAVTEARGLVRALERARLLECVTELHLGSAFATLPVSAAAPARLVSGVERTLLGEYRLEVAPQIWMPKPRIETVFDGAGFECAYSGGRLEADVWKVAIGPVLELAKETAQVGRLQSWSRRDFGGRVTTEPGTVATLALSGRPEDVGTVKCTPR